MDQCINELEAYYKDQVERFKNEQERYLEANGRKPHNAVSFGLLNAAAFMECTNIEDLEEGQRLMLELALHKFLTRLEIFRPHAQ